MFANVPSYPPSGRGDVALYAPSRSTHPRACEIGTNKGGEEKKKKKKQLEGGWQTRRGASIGRKSNERLTIALSIWKTQTVARERANERS